MICMFHWRRRLRRRTSSFATSNSGWPCPGASAEVESQILDFTRQRRARGAASDADIEKLIVQLETTRGTLIPLQAQIEASLNSLAVLTGAEPGALDTELSAAGPIPEVPAAVAIGDPASMLRRRPDIRAAERALAASNARIGTEVANYFPKVNFLGDIGWGSTDTAVDCLTPVT